MSKTTLILLCTLVMASCSSKPGLPDGYPPVTEAEASSALQDALSLSLLRSIAEASRIDGFYANPRLRIDLPDGTETLQQRLRQIGLGRQIDRVIVQINRVAESAAAKAKPVFIKAITALDIDDPFDLLSGGDNAATDYLADQARKDLYAEFQPLVANALNASDALKYYRKIVERHNALPFSYDVDPQLEEHIATKTVDGLLILMAQEEARIRRVPAARGTRQVHRVVKILE